MAITQTVDRPIVNKFFEASPDTKISNFGSWALTISPKLKTLK